MNTGKEMNIMNKSSWATNGRWTMNSSSKALTLLIGLFWMVSMALATELTDIQVESGSGEVRFLLNLDGEPGNPSVFTTEQPPRIVLELPDTNSRVDSSKVPVGAGPASSYTAVSAGGRTRLVVDMSRNAPYEVQVSGNQVARAGKYTSAATNTREAATKGTTPAKIRCAGTPAARSSTKTLSPMGGVFMAISIRTVR